MSLSPISLAGAAYLPPDGGAMSRSAGSGEAPFANVIDRVLSGAVHSGDKADMAVRDLALGRTDNLHEVMRQVAQADLSFRLILEIRNRLTEAYQEIMKMQV